MDFNYIGLVDVMPFGGYPIIILLNESLISVLTIETKAVSVTLDVNLVYTWPVTKEVLFLSALKSILESVIQSPE